MIMHCVNPLEKLPLGLSGSVSRSRLRPGDVHLYHICEEATGAVICLMIVFAPWAFGTTQGWSTGTMNGCGYFLGALLAIKLVIRRSKGLPSPRWDDSLPAANSVRPRRLTAARLNTILLLLTVAI